jgi:subtilase family serine protease
VRLNLGTGQWEPIPNVPASSHPAPDGASSGGINPDTSLLHGNDVQFEDVSPWDFATIYNVTPLWNAAIKGTGQTIYIAGRSNINMSDIQYFQEIFGLPTNPPAVIITNSDPGTGSTDDLMENTSDVEMAGAIAPGANIVLVTSSSTASSNGVYLSAQYIVNHGPLLPTTPAIMSYSYGACESAMNSGGSNTLYNNLWQSAASEGIAVFVSSGNSGSAMCDGIMPRQRHHRRKGGLDRDEKG